MRLLLLFIGLSLCRETTAQVIAYIRDTETLLQQMPTYQEQQAVLEGELAAWERQLETKQQTLQNYYNEVMDYANKSCGLSTEWWKKAEDSLQCAQLELQAMACIADSLLELRKIFLRSLVEEELEELVEVLAKREGYDLVVKHTVLGYGTTGIDATHLLQPMLGIEVERKALPTNGVRPYTQRMVYVKDPDSLIAEMAAYRASQVELAAYAKQLHHKTEAAVAPYLQKEKDLLELFQRMCSTPKWQMDAQDSIHQWQAAREAIREGAANDLAARAAFVHAFVVDEFECAVETLARTQGYCTVIDGRQVIYGAEWLNIAPFLPPLLGIKIGEE